MWQWKGLLTILIMATVLNMTINPAMSLLPILITRYFDGSALQLGWINSAWGIGVIAGGLTLSLWGGFKRRIATTLLGLIGMGIGFSVVGVSPAGAFWLGLTGMAIGGFMNPICNGPLMAVVQSGVEPERQGRVFTVIGSISAAASPLGMAIAGPVADWLGVQAWFLIGGLLCILMGTGFFFVPAVMNLEQGREPSMQPAERAVSSTS